MDITRDRFMELVRETTDDVMLITSAKTQKRFIAMWWDEQYQAGCLVGNLLHDHGMLPEQDPCPNGGGYSGRAERLGVQDEDAAYTIIRRFEREFGTAIVANAVFDILD